MKDTPPSQEALGISLLCCDVTTPTSFFNLTGGRGRPALCAAFRQDVHVRGMVLAGQLFVDRLPRPSQSRVVGGDVRTRQVSGKELVYIYLKILCVFWVKAV